MKTESPSKSRYIFVAFTACHVPLVHFMFIMNAQDRNITPNVIRNDYLILASCDTELNNSITLQIIYAALNAYLGLTLLEGLQRLYDVSTSNLEVYTVLWWVNIHLIYFWIWWIFTYLNLKYGQSWTNGRFIIVLFCLFESESWSRKKNRRDKSLPNYYSKKVNSWGILT